MFIILSCMDAWKVSYQNGALSIRFLSRAAPRVPPTSTRRSLCGTNSLLRQCSEAAGGLLFSLGGPQAPELLLEPPIFRCLDATPPSHVQFGSREPGCGCCHLFDSKEADCLRTMSEFVCIHRATWS